ncbi:MAG: zinc-ribbon domain-containing protein [Planctomycetes bacterium]|nr:zinc-ribbon domain-containing protein [Planctomycetota bacterium]
MAFSITCSSCSAKLKTAVALPAGRKIQCPKCKNSIVIDDDNIVEVSDGAPAAPKPAARITTQPKKAPPAADDEHFGFGGSRQREDEEDDRPRKKPARVEEARPSKRRRDDDDEDDAPRARKRRDDDEDESPRARKRRDDDEDDDRPSRHRRDEDDLDEEDDRPRKKKKKKRKKGGSGLLIFGILGLLLLGGGGFALYYFVLRSGIDSEMMALMPSETTSLVYVDVSKLYEHSKAKKLVEKSFNEDSDFAPFKTAGLTPSDIKSFMEGNGDKGGSVRVFRLKNSLDKNKMTSGGEALKTADNSYWKIGKKENLSQIYVAFPSSDVVLFASNEDSMKSLLNKESGKIVISEQLHDLAKKVGKGDVWHVHVSKSNEGGDGGNADEVAKARRRIKGSASKTDISSNSVTRSEFILCGSEDDAKKIAEKMKKEKDEAVGKIDEMFKSMEKGDKKPTEAQKEAIKKSMREATLSNDGSTIETAATIDLTPFDDSESPFGISRFLR